jgi:hypothetical protein
MRKLLLVAASLVLTPGAIAQNPHDGYAFWLPSGVVQPAQAPGQATGHSFAVELRRTRFGTPRGQLVIVPAREPAGAPEVTVDGQPAGRLGWTTFVPADLTSSKTSVQVSIAGPPARGQTYRLYWTDDAFWLGRAIEGSGAEGPGFRSSRYDRGLAALFQGDFAAARRAFLAGAESGGERSRRLHRRLARWCDAEMAFARLETASGFYGLGLFAMLNGFWKLAERSFERATQLRPDDPDAWFMLAKATSYVHSDLGDGVARAYPFYRRAADLYPREGSGQIRNFFGLFRRLRVRDGEGTRVLEMTDDQIEHAKRNWAWCTAIIESASRGALRLQNTWREFEEEFDATAGPNGHGAGPYLGLFERGSQDVFIRMTGWGASDCLGMDCGPNRTAFINLGIREWDVMLHEWNHALDWALIASELGIGVPVTHSSDWCGFQPISSMGMGHLSCNRYSMTPGMYRFVRGSDPATTPWIDAWRVAPLPRVVAPVLEREAVLDPNRMDPWRTERTREVAAMAPPDPSECIVAPRLDDGYVDLKATFLMSGPNVAAFAHTYVYSPRRQRVRAWLGADDNIKVWLNGALVHRGVYWSVTLFTEARERDQVAAAITLERGWNSLMVQATNLQRAPCWLGGDPPDQWGFSVRLCDAQNRALPGVRWQADRPEGYRPVVLPKLDPARPRTFAWDAVADDFTALLPELSLADLRAITGNSGLTVSNEMLFDVSGQGGGLAALGRADPGRIALDNQLNWFFSPWEMTAAVRYRRGGTERDLWFLRVDGMESFMRLARVTPEARRLGIREHSTQVIGFFRVPREDSPNGRLVLVLDTYLGADPPVDEENLLDLSALR